VRLREIGGQQNSTIVFPMPIDLMRPMLEAMGKSSPTGQSESPPVADADRQLDAAPTPELTAATEDLPPSLRERNGQAAETPRKPE
jgi:hypothetical protein